MGGRVGEWAGTAKWFQEMKLITCPLNGPRNASEFICGGPVKAAPPPDAPDRDWADYLFLEDNPAGRVREWWCHLPSSYWFIVERDTLTEENLDTYPADRLVGGAAS